jgi:hypothetical protein
MCGAVSKGVDYETAMSQWLTYVYADKLASVLLRVWFTRSLVFPSCRSIYKLPA